MSKGAMKKAADKAKKLAAKAALKEGGEVKKTIPG